MVTRQLSPVMRPSLADLVYQQLVDGILSGKLASGAHLNVADIAKEMQVSPSPVRDALMRLATQGLISNNTNRRATVTRFERAELEELFEVREILECAAAEKAASRIEAAAVKEIRQAVEECAAFADQPAQKKAMLDLDNHFHLLVAGASGNQALREEILRCNRRIRVVQWLRLDHRRMGGAYEEHLAVVQALERHDGPAARLAMSTHIRSSLRNVLSGLAAGS